MGYDFITRGYKGGYYGLPEAARGVSRGKAALERYPLGHGRPLQVIIGPQPTLDKGGLFR